MANTNKTYDDFLAAIRQRESTDRYNFMSKAGYLGAYQFAEITMKNLGYYKGDGTSKQDWVGDFTGKDGVTSKSKLLNSPALQDKVFDNMLKLYWGYANQSNYHMPEHIGETVDGLKVTPSLIVAGSHLLGIGKMRDFLDNKLDLSSGTHHYMTGLSGYELPFVSGSTATAQSALTTTMSGSTVTSTAGVDTLVGNGRNDILDGKAGADIMKGGAGNDIYYVDNGKDQVTEASGQGTDTVKASTNVTLAANVENGQLLGSAQTGISGNGMNNSLIGNSAVNTLRGEGGNDTLNGNSGADKFFGGAGKDVFVFDTALEANRDTAFDFVHATDKLKLSSIDAKSAVSGNQGFTFLGYVSGSKGAGSLWAIEDTKAGVTHLYGDIGGSSAADFHIDLKGLHLGLTPNDFYL